MSDPPPVMHTDSAQSILSKQVSRAWHCTLASWGMHAARQVTSFARASGEGKAWAKSQRHRAKHCATDYTAGRISWRLAARVWDTRQQKHVLTETTFYDTHGGDQATNPVGMGVSGLPVRTCKWQV